MKGSTKCLLGLRQLQRSAQEALVVPDLETKALLSVSPLANSGYATKIFHLYTKRGLQFTIATHLNSP